MSNDNDCNYWVVGASFGGLDHADQDFVKEGYWMLGWDEESKGKPQYESATQMKAGDRIAIKRMKGSVDNKNIKILHLGIIKKQLTLKENSKILCIVDWIAKDLKREVPIRNFMASVHGPFKKDDNDKKAWLEEIFCL